MPPSFAFHRQKVVSGILSFRVTSWTLAPASTSFSTLMTCSSVDSLFRIRP